MKNVLIYGVTVVVGFVLALALLVLGNEYKVNLVNIDKPCNEFFNEYDYSQELWNSYQNRYAYDETFIGVVNDTVIVGVDWE